MDVPIPEYIRRRLMEHHGRDRSMTLPHQLVNEAAVVFGLGCSLDDPFCGHDGRFGVRPIGLTEKQYRGWQEFAEWVGGTLSVTKPNPKSISMQLTINPPEGLPPEQLRPVMTIDERNI